MTEDLIRGLISGAALGCLMLLSHMIWKIIRSPSEGARRFRIVGGIALALLVGTVMILGMGPLGALGTVIVIAAIVWVIKGFTAKSTTPVSRAEPESRYAEPKPARQREPAKFTEIEEIKPTAYTVIACPNCSGRLRVKAGKYLDIKCTHCQTLFRMHT